MPRSKDSVISAVMKKEYMRIQLESSLMQIDPQSHWRVS